jgi:hypothetical protein
MRDVVGEVKAKSKANSSENLKSDEKKRERRRRRKILCDLPFIVILFTAINRRMQFCCNSQNGMTIIHWEKVSMLNWLINQLALSVFFCALTRFDHLHMQCQTLTNRSLWFRVKPCRLYSNQKQAIPATTNNIYITCNRKIYDFYDFTFQ